MPELSRARHPRSLAPPVLRAAVARSLRVVARRAHGGGAYRQVIVDIAEYRATGGGGGYAWKAEAWYGGDINRLVLKTEGDGRFRGVLLNGVHFELQRLRLLGAAFRRAKQPGGFLRGGGLLLPGGGFRDLCIFLREALLNALAFFGVLR